MEQIKEELISDSSFLPFYELEPRIERSIKIIELMDSLSAVSDLNTHLSTLLRSTLEGFAAQSAFIIVPHFEPEGKKWTVIAHSDLEGTSQESNVQLEVTHPLINAISAGNICVTRTNGDGFELNPTKEYATGTYPTDSQQLLVVPLIENLVTRAALVLVLQNKNPVAVQDLEMLSAVQAVFSFFFFKTQKSLVKNFESASRQFAFEVLTGLNETQLRIGHLIFQEKSDNEILDLLGLTKSKFDEEYGALLDFLMVTTREDVAAELRVLHRK